MTVMACGHTANGTNPDGSPVCAIDAGTPRDAASRTPAPDAPDLTGRRTRCGTCGSIENSDGTNPTAVEVLTPLIGQHVEGYYKGVDGRLSPYAGTLTGLLTDDPAPGAAPGAWITEGTNAHPSWYPLAVLSSVTGHGSVGGARWMGPAPFLSVNPDYDGDTRLDSHYCGCRGWN